MSRPELSSEQGTSRDGIALPCPVAADVNSAEVDKTSCSTDPCKQILFGNAADLKQTPFGLHLSRANRHGLIAGATGGGKTVTLQVLAEGFAKSGVPVLVTDVKGDLAGLSQPGVLTPSVLTRWQALRQPAETSEGLPVTFWDVFGDAGLPLRMTIEDMGPVLLSSLLELTDAQDGVLGIAFRLAQDFDLPLIDLADLRSILFWMAGNGDRIALQYGSYAAQSIGGIQRRLNGLEYEGLSEIFSPSLLDLDDMLHPSMDGIGQVNILSANHLMRSPRLYGAVLVWLLQTLQDRLPEVGDVDVPRLVLFFDEAHLLFRGSSKVLTEKIEQVIRLIRSKGVGIYFVTQSPSDLPGPVLSQLGNRFLHGLRGYTPGDLKAIRSAADAFRSNPNFDTEAAIGDLGIGEALVSTLQANGEPAIVRKALIRPPGTQIGTINPCQRAAIVNASPLRDKYCGLDAIDTGPANTTLRLDAAFKGFMNPEKNHTQTALVPVIAALQSKQGPQDHPARRLHRRFWLAADTWGLPAKAHDKAERFGRALSRGAIRILAQGKSRRAVFISRHRKPLSKSLSQDFPRILDLSPEDISGTHPDTSTETQY